MFPLPSLGRKTLQCYLQNFLFGGDKNINVDVEIADGVETSAYIRNQWFWEFVVTAFSFIVFAQCREDIDVGLCALSCVQLVIIGKNIKKILEDKLSNPMCCIVGADRISEHNNTGRRNRAVAYPAWLL